MSDKNQGLYPKETIANLLNLSERRLEQLAKQKIIPKAGRGVFDLGSTVTAYVRYLQGLTTGAIRASETSELDKRLLEAKVLERESKARQAKYRADAMEQDLENRNLRKRLSKIPDELNYKMSLFQWDEVSMKATMHKITPLEEFRRKVKQEITVIVDEILNGCEES